MDSITKLFRHYDKIAVLDTETSGLNPETDQIIQMGLCEVRLDEGKPRIWDKCYDMVELEPNRHLTSEIMGITGITEVHLAHQGRPAASVCRKVERILSGKTLIAAYNAHFDLSFLYHMLARYGHPEILRGKDKLDILTVYRDRRPGSHKLMEAARVYGVSAYPNHVAIQDAVAAWEVLAEMAREKNDILNYVNLFGYNPQHGVPRRQISSVRYLPQEPLPRPPLYEEQPKKRRGFMLRDFYEMFEEDARLAQRELDLRLDRKKEETP